MTRARAGGLPALRFLRAAGEGFAEAGVPGA